MNWQELLDPDIQKFIKQHEKSDVSALALKKPPNQDWPYALILEQIKARQKIHKIPSFDQEGIVYPSSNLIEQASSEACAQYKANLLNGGKFVDLTAGSGSDTAAFAKSFQEGIAVEKDKQSAEILKHNLKVLGLNSIEAKNQSAEEFIKTMKHADLVYIDPQRRNQQRRGIYNLSECSPNILAVFDHLKANQILVKTSPVLDIQKTMQDLGNVTQVHIVEYKGECKELLFLIDRKQTDKETEIFAVQINDKGEVLKQFDFTFAKEKEASCVFSEPLKYLYEPSPAFQKAGAYHLIAQRYDVQKIHPNTHLYTSKEPCKNFPGRVFKICDIAQANHKKLKQILPSMKANVTIRNFPLAIDALKKKLKIKDGGDITLFACTDVKEDKIIIKCEKY